LRNPEFGWREILEELEVVGEEQRAPLGQTSPRPFNPITFSFGIFIWNMAKKDIVTSKSKIIN